ncbi:hypothetical protein [Mesorhizobium ventifaucium]|uniref:Uncharacterized protein n=1 Tax=Mesorhizobium ventifaucium TaxID=666020 RepID=A0ABM9DRB3_9HYPH|nr:hypothetical protein [Mesorhizobium ventifaucium]CAH2399194.1 conserved hypothetical protein [Mesorhizobium ventifaucium]
MTAWTAKAVEYRVLEAAETLMLTPNVGGAGGSAWPEYIPHYPRAMKIRIRPSPGALSRMTETWGWINAHPIEENRRLLYAWAWQKTKRGRFLNDFASREGIKTRTLRDKITKICQSIADALLQQQIPCFEQAVDDVAEIEPETASQTVSSETSAQAKSDAIVGFMEPGAKPRYPTQAEIAALRKRLEKQNRKRKKASAEAGF